MKEMFSDNINMDNDDCVNKKYCCCCCCCKGFFSGQEDILLMNLASPDNENACLYFLCL